jgi:hypothetical protein
VLVLVLAAGAAALPKEKVLQGRAMRSGSVEVESGENGVEQGRTELRMYHRRRRIETSYVAFRAA